MSMPSKVRTVPTPAVVDAGAQPDIATATAPPAADPTHARAEARPLFEGAIVRRAVVDALLKLDPRRMIRNPVMFVVEVGSAYTTFLFMHALVTGQGEASPWFILAVSI